MKTVADFNFKGKKVLVRVDYNVPLDKNRSISDDTRVTRSKETIQKIVQDGGRVVLLSHLGRPKNGPEESLSFKALSNNISKALGHPVTFIDGTVGVHATSAINKLDDGQIALLENVRFHGEEESNNEDFSKSLVAPVDFYVNEAFGCSHRAHASVYGVPNLLGSDQKCAGFLLNKEIQCLEKVFNTEGVKTAIIGGSKVSTKIDILKQLMDKVDNIIIGGAMVFTFIKAQGGQTGSSLVEDSMLDVAKDILSIAEKNQVQIYLPEDAIIADAFEESANTQQKDADQIPEGWMGLDVGPKGIQKIDQIISKSDAILWNGPMGVFEMSSFSNGTRALGESIAKGTRNGAFSVVGGGDTVAAVNKFNQQDDMSYICTGGGAMLELLGGKVLPGVAALKS